uniref:Uncharacterized protein n=1 Tax=Amphimedon queenslandica TaxID=400682 RepID=A0A1X7U826_AMPQE
MEGKYRCILTSECSLTLANYVSHMQNLWQDILDDRDIYSKLFRVCIRCLDMRHIGLYKHEIILSEPLCRISRQV